MATRRRRRHVNAHEKRLVGARAKWHCEACAVLLDETFECDHRVPLWAGGDDTLEALQALCATCHRKKTVREEIARLDLRRRAAASSASVQRPPLACTRCDRIVSPYFAHVCTRH
tara:strand:+ start:608 stop:952 length:345 start_codon:yes stop_codon:yes gene_type:complete